MDLDGAVAVDLVPSGAAFALAGVSSFGLARGGVAADELAGFAGEQVGGHRFGHVDQLGGHGGGHLLRGVGHDCRVLDVDPPFGQRLGQPGHLGQPTRRHRIALGLPLGAATEGPAHDG